MNQQKRMDGNLNLNMIDPSSFEGKMAMVQQVMVQMNQKMSQMAGEINNALGQFHQRLYGLEIFVGTLKDKVVNAGLVTEYAFEKAVQEAHEEAQKNIQEQLEQQQKAMEEVQKETEVLEKANQEELERQRTEEPAAKAEEEKDYSHIVLPSEKNNIVKFPSKEKEK